jgi:pimeloyl-ACP methyl ester carboxylesterase
VKGDPHELTFPPFGHPEGPGSVWGAPNLPPGFTDTFTSRYVDTGQGTGEIFFGAEFDASAGTNKLPNDAVKYYIDTLASDPEALRGSFGFYRAIPTTAGQNQQRKEQRLTMPVLAIGGAESSGVMVGATMQLVADNVQTVVLAGAGHWVAEQAPEELLAALATFLAPYGDGQTGSTSTSST